MLVWRKELRIMQASTSEIYGDPEVHPQSETYKGAVSTDGPELVAMKERQKLFFDYKRQYNVDVKVIRIFNTYGQECKKHMGELYLIL